MSLHAHKRARLRPLRRALDRLPGAGAALLTAAALIAGQAGADDTEVFFGQIDRDKRVQPNVLFVIDTSGSMNWGVQDGRNASDGEPSRLDQLKSAMKQVLYTTSDVNVGLMRMNGSNGGGAVIYPITPIDQDVCADGGCGDLTVTAKVSAQEDNAEEDLNRNNNNTYTDGNILSFGHENSSTNQPQTVGMRFPDLDVPQGAIVTGAFIDFTARESDNGPASYQIEAEQSVDVAPYVDRETDGVTSRALRSAAPVPWTPPAWTRNNDYSSPDIRSLVQDVVNDPDWCGGQALGLVVSGVGNRDAKTYRSGGESEAPRLRVTYTMQGTASSAGCQLVTTAAMLKQDGDDVVQQPYDGEMRPSWQGMAIPYNPGGLARIGGLRFADVPIPAGSEIVDARLQFENRDREVRTPLSFDIALERADDAAPFNSNDRYNLTDRDYTGPVAWNSVPGANAGDIVLTPNLAPIVQEIVDRGGWQNNNALLFRLDGTSSGTAYRTFVTREWEESGAPRLLLTYRSFRGAGGNAVRVARDEMIETIDDLRATGGTPVTDVLLEAAQYYLGRDVLDGTRRGQNRHHFHRVSHRGSYIGQDAIQPWNCDPSNPDDWDCRNETIPSGAVYKPQLNLACQASSIVLLTDGEPNSSVNLGGVQSIIGESCPPGNSHGVCAVELAEYLVNNDLNPGVPGEQKIRTHTVSFNTNNDPNKETVLNAISTAGGGETFKATDTDTLVSAFRTILSSVQSIDTSFTAPGATVNQYNRLTHRDDIYFALFRPMDTPLWPGNLKKYKIGRGSDPQGELEIRGIDGAPAVDAESGFFAESAKSFWPPEANGGVAQSQTDGKTVSAGGAAAQMDDVSNRQVYTFLGDPEDIPSAGIDLNSQAAYRLHEDNAGITSDVLNLQGVPSSHRADYRDDLLKWARGLDVQDGDNDGDTTDGRRHIGDPMHSRPIILNYANDRSIIYLSTNEGFLHAIDTEDGEELFAFMPKHLFGNLDRFFVNTASTKHPYGLDGQVSIWRDDPNQNYVIDANERAILYTGMRRGGRNYYAFDVTDHDNPKLAWTIEGGVPGNDFEELGQSWSRATPTKMRINNVVKDVLVIGGGYAPDTQDPDHNSTVRSQPEDAQGRALFIVDAMTGEKLWSVGHPDATGVDTTFSDMKYSLPADVRIVDVDLDGLADQLYTADMGGQVWRFDVKPSFDSSTPLMEGGVMAKINTNNERGHRRFYNEPDVALIEKDGSRFMAVSIGSGWRAHPLDKIVEDRFYVFKSPYVRTAPGPGNYGFQRSNGTYRPIRESDLVDVAAAEGIPETNDHGWFLDFETTGEKVLGKSVTFDNSVVFSTYVPDAASASNPCAPAIGGGRAYILSAINGYPTRDISGIANGADFSQRDQGDGMLDEKDRSINLMHGGIAPEPAILITEDGTPLLLVGPEKIEAGFDNPTKRTFWADRGKAEPPTGAANGEQSTETGN